MHDIELLYIEDILAIHEEAIKSFGGSLELYKDFCQKSGVSLTNNIPILIMKNILQSMKRRQCSGIS
ncbi:hypothetical protein SDC9_05067 [bioreactor metagenome]|uniref:Uncharacterized protein n=2 Tax=root TaxID=1 RepID=A0A098B3M4_DESHA|nr:Hypothetical protein DPCES_3075 [Desulfitobacterium hafniense]